MAFYNKVGLLILNEEKNKFMVCEPGDKYKNKNVTQYLMPGGKFEEENDEECLRREIKEELNCELDAATLMFINEYVDAAAAGQGRDVSIRLYTGQVIGTPVPSSEIGALVWIGKEDINNPKVSPIIKNKIIPDLLSRGVLN